MNKDVKDFFMVGGVFAMVLIIIGTIFIIPIYYGWAITYLWGMFAVPLGYAALPMQLVVGCFMIKNLAFANFKESKPQKHAWFMMLLLPLVSIVFGYIVLWILPIFV